MNAAHLVTLLLTLSLGPGDHACQLEVDGRNRTYLVHVPPGYDAQKPTPVVLVFHGAAMNAEKMVRFCNLNPKADEAGFVAVYPDGTGLEGFRTFNAAQFLGGLGRWLPDDVKFVATLLNELPKEIHVDRSRVFATGLSNGGMMCHRLAAELSDRIAAIAPVAGTLAVNPGTPQRPVSVLHFHGTADAIVPYARSGDENRSPHVLRSVDETIQQWVKLNGCQTEPKIAQLPDAQEDGTRVERHSFLGGRENTVVELIRIEGGGHTWPGGPPAPGFLGKSTRDIRANDMLWEFFQSHGR